MLKPHGITVILHDKTQTGTDPLGQPVYEETETEIENVLVAPATAQEILDSTNLYGKKVVYNLAIPKDDDHDWIDKRVTFFDTDWHVFGIPTKGIDDLIPGAWNTKLTVEKYE